MDFARIKRIITRSLPTLGILELKRRFPGLCRALSVKPAFCVLLLTGRCSFRCRTCGVWRDRPPGELTTEEWEDVLRQLRREGIHTLYLSGGEPLLRDDLLRLVRHAYSLGFFVSISTNGYLLTEKRALELVDAGARQFAVSVDAIGPYFDAIRGIEGGYAAVRSACESLSKLCKEEKIEAFICITLSRLSLPHVLDVARMADALNLPFILNGLNYTPFIFRSATDEDLWIGAKDQDRLDEVIDGVLRIKDRKKWLARQRYMSLYYLREYFKDPLRKDIACAKSLMRIIVGPDGKCYGGCQSMGPIGNVRYARLRDIIRSREYRHAHENMFRKSCPGCSGGIDIDIAYSLRCVVQEYAHSLLRGGRIHIPVN